MNSNYKNSNEVVISAPAGMTELVRGTDQRLVECASLLLRERNVVLDLTNITRIDAAGVAALISLYGVAHEAGHQFTICNPSHHVREILSLVRLDGVLLSHDAVCSLHNEPRFEQSAA